MDSMYTKKSSLSMYCTDYSLRRKCVSDSIGVSAQNNMMTTAVTSIVNSVARTTLQYNTQYNTYLNHLTKIRETIGRTVEKNLKVNPVYDGKRGSGVELAWKYEKADVLMGGRGSAKWNHNERDQIIRNGKVEGAEGHHQKNVADNRSQQGNPDNIKFYKSKKAHLEEGHKGNFQNETDAPFIDKNQMLKRTNEKRVIKNEVRGIAISAAIGFGIGFGLGVVCTLAQLGVHPDSFKYAFMSGAKLGIESGVQSIIGYGIGRTIGQIASKALQGMLSNMGLEVTQKVAQMCNMGAVGALTIAVFSVISFIKLIKKGESVKSAAIKVGWEALFSLSLLALSIAAQGIWGGYAGLIVSVSTGIIIMTYNVIDIVHTNKFRERVREYTIDKCIPAF